MANPPAKTFATYTPHAESMPVPQPGTYESRIFQRKLTHAAERPPAPLVDMKVMNLGMPRTGTVSLRKALYTLGYFDVYHMLSIHEGVLGDREMWIRALRAKLFGQGTPLSSGEWHQLLGYSECFSDAPPALFVEEMLAMYPDAQIILTTRDSAAAWAKSVRDTLGYARELTWFLNRGVLADLFVVLARVPPQLQFIRLIIEATMGPTNASFEREAEQRYEAHNELVRRLAREQGRDVLEYNVKEGWAPLCRYLGKDVPEEAFPRFNDTQEWRARTAKLRKMSQAAQKAQLRKKVIVALQVLGVAGAAAFVLRRYVGSLR